MFATNENGASEILSAAQAAAKQIADGLCRPGKPILIAFAGRVCSDVSLDYSPDIANSHARGSNERSGANRKIEVRSMNTYFPSSCKTIRPCLPPDIKAVRMLIPEVQEASVCFVATDEANRVIGVAAATRTCRPQPPIGPGIALHVIEPCRRQGIGKGLLQCLERAALGEGAHGLYGASRVEQGSDAMYAWQWLGLTPCETVETQRLPLDQFEPRLAPLIERMQSQRRIPAAAQIIPLYEANKGAVLNLHLDNLGGDRADLYRKLCSRGPGAFHPRYSRVLLVDGKVAGCILAHRKDGDTAIVDADIVSSSLRGGWANVWLKLEATRGAIRLGIKNFEFTSFNHYTDTRSFTQKMGGITVRTTLLMFKLLAVQPSDQVE